MGTNNSTQLSHDRNLGQYDLEHKGGVIRKQGKRHRRRLPVQKSKPIEKLVEKDKSFPEEESINQSFDPMSCDVVPVSLESRSCPICFECSYKTPKLLPCCHTFCLPCLRNHFKNNPLSDTLICPMCRANNYVPEGGLKELPANYFVAADKSTCCDICRDDEGKHTCDHCENILCTACQKKHKCQRSIEKHGGLRLFSLIDSSDSSDTDSDSSSNRSDASVPWSFTRPQKPWTKILLKEVFKFRLNDDKKCFSIVTISPEEAWMLTGNADVFSLDRYDMHGNAKQNIILPSISLGFAFENSKSLLVTYLEETKVCRLTGSEANVIVPPSTFHPLRIANFQSGEIVIAGFEKHNLQECSLGCVKFFENSGKELSNFTTGYDIIPTMTCVLTDDLIVFTYPDNNFVDIRLKDGHVVGRYNGNNGDDDDSFEPYALCRGHYCNNPVVFVSDGHSDTIHVISYAAEFIGLALKARIPGNSDLGEPGGICFDPSGKLWVGQRDDNTVTIYDIYKYSNVME